MGAEAARAARWGGALLFPAPDQFPRVPASARHAKQIDRAAIRDYQECKKSRSSSRPLTKIPARAK